LCCFAEFFKLLQHFDVKRVTLLQRFTSFHRFAPKNQFVVEQVVEEKASLTLARAPVSSAPRGQKEQRRAL
jgi:hypothetical protein